MFGGSAFQVEVTARTKALSSEHAYMFNSCQCGWNPEAGWEARKSGARSCRVSQAMVRTWHFVLCVTGGAGGGLT